MTDFPSLRFYVKSILETESSETAVFAIFWALDFVELVNISLQKVRKSIEIQIQSLSMR